MAEVQVIVFALDRPVSKKRPLHARSNGPANAGLRARSQVERCKDRRGGVTGVDRRRAKTRGNVVAKSGRHSAGEMIFVSLPGYSSLAVNQSLIVICDRITEASGCGGQEISHGRQGARGSDGGLAARHSPGQRNGSVLYVAARH